MFVIAVVTALHLVPLAVMTGVIIGIAVAAVAAATAAAILRRRWRGLWIFAAFFVAGSTIHVVRGADVLHLLLYVAVIAVTWGSALDYVWVADRELAGARDFHVFDSWRLLGAITIPVLAALCVQRVPSLLWALVTLVCVEICHGGLDNLLANQGAASGGLPWAARTLSVTALLGGALWLPDLARPLVLAALGVTAVATSFAFASNRRAYLT
jgi:hypothetical protein